MALYSRYIAIGDSVSEGYGDEGPDGVPRGAVVELDAE